MSENPKIIAVKAYIKALCDHDLVAIEALYSPDATIEDPVGSAAISGTESILGFYRTGFSSGLKARLDGPIRLADCHAVFPFVVEVTAGDTSMFIDVIDQFTFNDDGKVIAMKAFWGPENTRSQ